MNETTDTPRVVHCWPHATPPAAGDQALCGYVFGAVFHPEDPGSIHCPVCQERSDDE